jgi:hypothetical protein
VVQSATASGTEHSKSRNISRKSLIVGKSESTATGGVINSHSATIAAARPLKSIFCVDNVSPAYGVNELCEFLNSIGVWVLSCFEVAPRFSRWQREQFLKQQRKGDVSPIRRAFRVCICKADIKLFLKAEAWPNDITISKWFFAKDANDDSDRMIEGQVPSHDATVGVSGDGVNQSRTKKLAALDKLAPLDKSDSSIVREILNRFEILQTSVVNTNNSEIETDMENTLLYAAQNDANVQPLAAGTPIKSTT